MTDNNKDRELKKKKSHHVCLLPEGPGADLAHERLLAGVNFEVLLEVEPLGVDEQAAHRAALVVRPAAHFISADPGHLHK